MSPNLLRTLLDNSEDYLAIVSKDGFILECNAAIAKAIGVPCQELLGKKVSLFVNPKIRKAFDRTVKEAFDSGAKCTFAATLNESDVHIPVDWKLTPELNLGGKVDFVILTGKDTRELNELTERLRTAEGQFNGFMDSLPGIAFIKDKSRRLVFVSKQFEEVFECSVEEGIGRRDESYLPRAVALRNKKIEERLLEFGGNDIRIEEDEAVQNNRRWMIHRFAYGEGETRQIGGLSLEITQLTEAEERFRALAEASTDAVAILRPKRDGSGKVSDFSFNYVNTFANHVFSLEGKSHDSFKSVAGAIMPADILPSLIRVVETGQPFEAEIMIGDPSSFQAQIQVQGVRAGDFVGLNIRDVSAEVQASKQSQLASIRFKTLFESNPAACMTLDLEGKVVDWNRQCEVLYGFTADEVKGKSIIDLVVGGEIRQNALEAIAETHRSGGIHEGSEWKVKRKDGKAIWVFSSSIPLNDENGTLIGTVSTNIDITALKETEAMLRSSNSDLEQFANVASHDLLEPLRMVCCYMDLLESQYGNVLDEDGRQFLRFALDGGLRMREMIKSLLDFSQVSKEPVAFESLSLADVVQDALENLQVALKVDPQPLIIVGKLPLVLGTKPHLVRLVQNLVSNSIKFKSSKPIAISILSEESDSGTVIIVKDNGIGIDPRFRDKVFKLFQRLHHKDEFEGCGIGLSVCKKIVEHHGGQIWVEDCVDGCDIRFTLQIAETDSVLQAA